MSRNARGAESTYPGSLTRDIAVHTQPRCWSRSRADLVRTRFCASSARQLTHSVPYDQWFLTHIDDTSKVKQAKLWLLAKCNLVQSPGSYTQRSVSPIVFAPTVRARSSLDSLDDGYNEDDEYSDPPHPIYPHRDPKPSPPRSSPLVDQYTLLSFSTGSILEDEFALSWYSLRPYELLEMHPVGTVAPLQRHVLAEYVQPYFQAKVRVLRAVWNHRSGRFEAPRFDEHSGHKAMDKLAHSFSTKSSSSQSEKKRKTKVDWKARWVVIHQGILFLCKEHLVCRPLDAARHTLSVSDQSATSPIRIEHHHSTLWRRRI